MKASDPYHPTPEFVKEPGEDWAVLQRDGASIRLAFIGMAMQGLCANVEGTSQSAESLAREAVAIADATLRAAGVKIDE